MRRIAERCWATLPSGLKFLSLEKLEDPRVRKLPLSLRILLEASVRHCDGLKVTEAHVDSLLNFQDTAGKAEFAWIPPRVLLQDLSGIPVLIDLCAMRDAVQSRGGDPSRVNPLRRVDLVVDHSVSVDVAGRPDALRRNMEIEMERNSDRFQFLKWAQQSFQNFNLVPPGSGIVHQVHCERLAEVALVQDGVVFPDACVGTDSHTTMINGMGIYGFGCGGLEVEAAMLGQPTASLIPEVVGLELTGQLAPGVTATDLVLTVTELLRQQRVVGKVVEVFGSGAECGATCILFSVDSRTLQYLQMTGREKAHVDRVEEYYRASGLFGAAAFEAVTYSSVTHLDLASVVPCMAGPKRPQDRIPLGELKKSFHTALTQPSGHSGFGLDPDSLGPKVLELENRSVTVNHGQLAIAAITSCTNTSNPSVLLAAGLLAKKAVQRGLRTPEHVKTSLAPGSRVVTRYLEAAGLSGPLEALGFHTVGYGCTTCMGNSGDVDPALQAAADQGLITAAVLSGNRNFEGRVHLSVKANYLASPPLVVAAALAGRVDIDFETEALGLDPDGREVFLSDVWPTPEEVAAAVFEFVRPEFFESEYALEASSTWSALEGAVGSVTYPWDPENTFIASPPFFQRPAGPIRDAYCLMLLGDSVTTDHICFNGAIRDGPALDFLRAAGVEKKDVGSYGARRGNASVMVRGTFSNPRILNKALDRTGPWALHVPSGEVLHPFDAAARYREDGYDLIIVAGSEYGTGSSRDWAAKGTALLGVRAVLAESFERIHRANLAGMGVLPLVFPGAAALGLTGTERFRLQLPEDLRPGMDVAVESVSAGGEKQCFTAVLRLDTEVEIAYWKQGGILPYVLESMLSS